MGRVSRIMKAVTEKPMEARPPGLERELTHSDPDLPRLIASWSAMPPHFRQTILTLVEIVEAHRGVVHAEPKEEPPPAES